MSIGIWQVVNFMAGLRGDEENDVVTSDAGQPRVAEARLKRDEPAKNG